jgi:SNF2 family DNA or RNA helicase
MHRIEHLRPWQRKAIAILSANRCQLLGAQPGAGKTITVLTAIAQHPVRTLLVAPSVVLNTVWPVEASRWEHTQHLVFTMAHHHSGSDRANLWMRGPGHIITATCDTLHKLVGVIHQQRELPFGRLVVDEAQFFKNAAATRTAALHALAEHVPTWLVSGSPAPNGVLDCWSPGRIASGHGEFWQ